MFVTVLVLLGLSLADGSLSLAPAEGNALHYVIDISSWDSTFNGNTCKNAGCHAVLCRSAYGMRADSTFATFMKSANSAGLGAGAYNYATWHYKSVSSNYNDALANAKKEANYFVSRLNSVTVTSYVALDMEIESSASTVLSSSQLTDISNTYMNILRSAGYKVLLYANADWVFNRLVTNKIAYPLWIAYYWRYGTPLDFSSHDGSFPNTSYGQKMKAISSKITMWQFTDEGYGKKYGSGASDMDKSYAYAQVKF